ncbi:MAG TPA: hypothetical protein DCZ94_14385 [Lentisphaeria bacterium]|nr:MAG: hypothetical protein A2X48_01650 [Lentisphaerae bacterium GWF2_49_21]HBC88135.1 hypothetical protein [Lentisphaeria bacterium]
MSTLLIVMLVLAVNLMPGDIKVFSIGIEPNNRLTFTKQADGGWGASKLGFKDEKSLGTFYVKGLMITALIDGKENKIDASKYLNVKTPDQIKDLTQINIGSKIFKIKKTESTVIVRSDDNQSDIYYY